jgi:uncharacterized membrane protein (DUF373 family)
MSEQKKIHTHRSYVVLGYIETAIYSVLGILMAAAGVLAIVGALPLFAAGVRDIAGTTVILQLIDRLLLVLMLVELLHTVRISIRSHSLVIEPFLIIGLIAIIRRILVVILHSEKFSGDMLWTPDVEAHFRASMIEAGVLAMLVAVLIASIFVVRRARPLEYMAQIEERASSPRKASIDEELSQLKP